MKCERCRFWQSPPKPGGAGECRRYVPQVLVMQGQGLMPGQGQVQTIAYFPPAPASSWCGQFEPQVGTA